MKMKKLMLTMVMCVCALQVMAITESFPYQVQLNLSQAVSGQPLAMRFAFFDVATNGVARWGRTVQLVPNANKVVSVVLSDELPRTEGDPLESYTSLVRDVAAKGGTLFLETSYQVEGGWVATVPRQAIVSVPLAQNVLHASRAKGDFQVSGSLVAQSVSADSLHVIGNTTVKSVNVAEKMTVKGGVTHKNDIVTRSDVTVTGSVRPGNESAIWGDVTVPIGTIVASAIPLPGSEGWALCDGTQGTPDLFHRFLVGANPSDNRYIQGSTGGANTVTLTWDQMPYHTHSFTYRTASDRGKDWTLVNKSKDWWGGGIAASTSSSSVGGNQAHSNTPGHCKLFYYMRIR